MSCAWCDKPLKAQKGGAFSKRFCGGPCRAVFHTACRRWALAALDAKLITIQTLKDTDQCLMSRVEQTQRRPKKPGASTRREAAGPAPAGNTAPS
jgi:hypothetical protein